MNANELDDRLRQSVYPAEWRNPIPQPCYHLVIIGAGTAGLVTAAGAAGLGAKVALVERHAMGGDCLNVGCVPSKAIIAAAERAIAARDDETFGITTGSVSIDFATAMNRMRRIRAGIASHDSAKRFQSLGVDVFLGNATFADPQTIVVDDGRLRFKKAVIATGTRPSLPPIPGLDQVDPLTNETVFDLTELPARLAVIGGGPIGCELGQALARLGSRVVLIERGERLLAKEDPDATTVVEQALRQDGVDLRLRCNLLSVTKSDGETRLTIQSESGETVIAVDRILVAAGRRPQLDGLGLEAAGVDFDPERGIRVDDRMRTSNRRVFAAGDVASEFKFTHAADFMARLVIRNSLFLGRQRFSSLVIPWCTYTRPELARVGMSSAQAARDGIAVDTFTVPFDTVDRAILEGSAAGFVRIHVVKNSDRIVGATIVGAGAGDLIGYVATAMTHRLGLGKFADVIHPYPTHAESMRKLGDQYRRSRLTPLVKSVFDRWLRWTL